MLPFSFWITYVVAVICYFIGLAMGKATNRNKQLGQTSNVDLVALSERIMKNSEIIIEENERLRNRIQEMENARATCDLNEARARIGLPPFKDH